MPYSAPPAYTKGLPVAVKRAWTSAFNSAYSYAKKKGLEDPEGYAFAVANKVANDMGWRRKNGKWVKSPKERVETLSLDTPDYQVLGATTSQLVSFHGRLHSMMGGENGEAAQNMHDLVSTLLSLRGVKHKD